MQHLIRHIDDGTSFHETNKDVNDVNDGTDLKEKTGEKSFQKEQLNDAPNRGTI